MKKQTVSYDTLAKTFDDSLNVLDYLETYGDIAPIPIACLKKYIGYVDQQVTAIMKDITVTAEIKPAKGDYKKVELALYGSYGKKMAEALNWKGYIPCVSYPDFVLPTSQIYDIAYLFDYICCYINDSLHKKNIPNNKDISIKAKNLYDLLAFSSSCATGIGNTRAKKEIMASLGKARYDYKHILDNNQAGYDNFIVADNSQRCYHCNNLLQVCVAIIDIVYRIYQNENISLAKCENCGHYYLAEHASSKYCDRIYIDGKTCREYKKAVQTKESGRHLQSNQKQEEANIKKALRDAFKPNSAQDTPKQISAKKAYDIFMAVSAKRQNDPDYGALLLNCKSYIILRDYRGLYEWLSREEV